MTAETLRRAELIAIDHGLRAYDSLHLATALVAAGAHGVHFACWDRELREAAHEHGFALIPEQV